MLKVDNINVYYGAIHAIKNVSFQVNEGEIVTLIGANGAGKSTILKTISGLLHTKTGSVSFQDHNLKSAPPHKIVEMGIAHVPEGRRVFSRMSVEENLEMGAFTQPNDSVNAAIEHVYERFPRLKERRKQVAGTLSGGEQQMLAIGRGLMGRPRLLLLDEPSLGLAPIIVGEVFDTIRRIRDEGITVILVEQNAKKSLSICDYAYVLENGRMVKSGPGRQMLDDPDIAAAYLGVREE